MFTVLSHRSPVAANVLSFDVTRMSALGNPYRVTSERSAAATIPLYRTWLARQIKARSGAWVYLGKLVEAEAKGSTVALRCWCRDGECCHAHVVKEVLESGDFHAWADAILAELGEAKQGYLQRARLYRAKVAAAKALQPMLFADLPSEGPVPSRLPRQLMPA